MDLNLFWYAQEALTSPDVYLAPDTPVRGTRHAYKLAQQRNQRITERAIRCHAYELQQAHNNIAQHLDRHSLHSPKDTNPLLEFICGDKFLRDNQLKFDKLLGDTESMMSSEYEPMIMSDEDSQAVKRKDDDHLYREKFRAEAEDAYNQCIQWHIDSQQNRWEELRRYMTDEAASIMNEVVEHQKSLAPPAPATHNEPIQQKPKRKRKRKSDQQHNQAQQQHSTPSLSSSPSPSSSVKKPQSQQSRPSASSSSIPPPVASSTPSSRVPKVTPASSIPSSRVPQVTPASSTPSSRVPKVIPASTSRSTGRSIQVPSVASSSSSSTSSSTPRVPEVASAPSWNASSYRPSLVHNGKISIKKIAGKGFQVVCEKKNEPIKILGTPQEFDEALYHPGPNSNIKLQVFQGTKVFRSVDNRGRLHTIAQVDEIEPLIRQYFLTSSRGHDRML